ncbi:6-phosphogluconolactonase [Lacticaseibacillus paracasei]|uniref:6-phosphogluconolactonase n=1 Tax=Lacticaseibacillus paracasei TaxID=1597 RepID=A0ABD6VY26_LACPA|nr:lactonase family protein [Lacticaseibacillus paracasei]POE40592.1 6-phosphogluconolactonase [Lacticaseibacillus paracasei]
MIERILFGGYTKKDGKGVYTAELNTTTSQVSVPVPYISSIDGPTYLAKSDKGILYVVTKKGEKGGISAFSLTGKQPELLNDSLSIGSSPAYVSVDNARDLVFSANYHTGYICVDRILPDGGLSRSDSVLQEGKGPRPEQEASHPHFADLTPDGRLVTVNLGTDTVTTYQINEDNKLSNPVAFHTDPGFGPRHIVFHPSLPVAYLVGELSSKVSVLQYSAKEGSFSVKQTVSTIPSDWTAHNGAAAVRISNDGKFLYVSNRGHNSIISYQVDAGGNLTDNGFTSTFGDFPRDFAIDPTGNFLLAVNQNSDTGTLYLRDSSNGHLTPAQINIPVPEGVCVLF